MDAFSTLLMQLYLLLLQTLDDTTNLIAPINDNYTVLLPAGQTTGNIVVNITRDYLFVASSPTKVPVNLDFLGSTLLRGNLTEVCCHDVVFVCRGCCCCCCKRY